jgi:CheY-like chemotaxis protein
MENRRVRIAIADDKAELRTMLKSCVERLGHEVVCTAGDGAELLAFCSDHPVDVVLIDFDMPVMDGLEAAEELSKKGIPAILISGHSEAMQIRVEHEPVVARLLKPPSLEELKSAIENALGKNL